ncbi:MAG TPA: response regulator [Planctomycetaceae bacterium]|nr:response regulator [Planctomycetaceae bacterium]
MTAPAVLITDDDAAFRETLGGVLEPLGLRTLFASDGREAIDIVEHEEVHLVLLDMHMPRLTGLETLRLVKQIKAGVPCILLSARLDDSIVEQARRAHAFSIMSKPVTRQQITGAVGQALRTAYNWPGQPRTVRITIQGKFTAKPAKPRQNPFHDREETE